MAEAILDRYTLVRVGLASSGSMQTGGASRTLVEQGWKLFLIRVKNMLGIQQPLQVSNGRPIGAQGEGPGRMTQSNNEQRAQLLDTLEAAPLIEKMWLLAQLSDREPLSGLAVEYRVLELFSRDRGQRTAPLVFTSGPARARLRSIDYATIPSRDVTLSILDSDGIGCMASLVIRDRQEHVYPPQVMRLAPDMAFHPHIYRADGENVRLPDGEFTVSSWRGPEYLRTQQTVRISDANDRIAVRLQRWIDPAKWGWYSGDTHIHAAGCAHYVHPTEGVAPETMIRHVRGEALSIGSAVNWGPGWYYQKQFFSGRAISPAAALEHPDLQAANNVSLKPRPTKKDGESLLRYDVEVSGFPSSFSGHLILLRLKEQDYPGARLIEDWPSWNLPILKWAKAAGGVVGFAHCGLGMGTGTRSLPNYGMPAFDSIGANEAIVDVTHDACDFLSGCEVDPTAELNAWYHMLNCGFRLAMVGETDYPCISDERPGIGRSYVHLDERPTDDDGYNAWIEGMKAGRLYFGDGRSHFLRFTVDGQASGGRDVRLSRPGPVEVRATVAARLEPQKDPAAQGSLGAWNVEHARIGDSRLVPVELVVNGYPVERREIVADGTPRQVRFRTRIERSSWVALRIMPSGHTHPVFVAVEGKPIRASRRSAEWLRKCVDLLWMEKHRLMRERERPAAAEAYDHARRTYDRIAAECEVA